MKTIFAVLAVLNLFATAFCALTLGISFCMVYVNFEKKYPDCDFEELSFSKNIGYFFKACLPSLIPVLNIFFAYTTIKGYKKIEEETHRRLEASLFQNTGSQAEM